MSSSETITTEAVKVTQPTKGQKSDGLISLLPTALRPTALRPYVEVTRFHKPAGLLGFYFPYMIGFFFSASIAGPTGAPPPTEFVQLIGIFLLDGLLLRSFGCAWNDTIDRDLDKKVARCKGRPVARGALSVSRAVLLTLVLAAARHALVALLLPLQANYHALFVTVLAFFYPFAKRITNYPQVVLGVAVGWAIFMVDCVVDHRHPQALKAMFAAQMLWNVTYDTVYAFQDLPDDERAGVKSMAVRFQHCAKTLLSTFVAAMAAFLYSAGVLAERTPVFFAGALMASVGVMGMLVKLDVRDPKSCRWFFVSGQWIVSGTLLAGLVGEYLWTTCHLQQHS